MHIGESHHLTIHPFAAVIAAEVNGFSVKSNLGGNGGRGDAIRNFRFGGMLFGHLAAACQYRNGCADAKY